MKKINSFKEAIILFTFSLTLLHGAEKNSDIKTAPYWVEVELSPVVSRPGSGWMKEWLRLAKPLEGRVMGHQWFRALIQDSTTDSSTLFLISNEEGRAILNISKVSRSPGEDEPYEDLPIEHFFSLIDKDLAIKINSITIKELLKVKYSKNTGRTIMLGGADFIVGADSINQPYAYFMGKCSMDKLSPLKWLEELTSALLRYTKASEADRKSIETNIINILENRQRELNLSAE